MAGILLSQYKPQSLIVVIDPIQDRIRKHFKCPVCGNTAFDYYGGLKLIMPGYDDVGEPTGETEVDWFKTIGVPFPIQCQNGLSVTLDNGERKKIKCKTMLLKVG